LIPKLLSSTMDGSDLFFLVVSAVVFLLVAVGIVISVI
jgi:hypothetical protein